MAKLLPQERSLENQENEWSQSRSSADELFNAKNNIGPSDVTAAFEPIPNFNSNAAGELTIDPTDIPLPEQLSAPGAGHNSNNNLYPNVSSLNNPARIEPVNIVVSSNNRKDKGMKKRWWGNKQEKVNALETNIQSHQELTRIKSASKQSAEVDGDNSPNSHVYPHSPLATNSTGNIVYVGEKSKDNRSINYTLICFALIFGILLMYALMLTYMVFIDPETMVCNRICGDDTNNAVESLTDGSQGIIGCEPIPTFHPTISPSNIPTTQPTNAPSNTTKSPFTMNPTNVPSKPPTPGPTGSHFL